MMDPHGVFNLAWLELAKGMRPCSDSFEDEAACKARFEELVVAGLPVLRLAHFSTKATEYAEEGNSNAHEVMLTDYVRAVQQRPDDFFL